MTSRGSNTFSVIDVDGMTLSKTVAAGEGPEGVDVSSDGRQLWVGNNQSQDIRIFDTETMMEISRIDVGFLPIRVRFHPDGKRVAVADLEGDRIVVYDGATQESVTEIDLTPSGAETPASLLFSPDGASLFVGAQSSGTVVEIDTDTWKIKRSLTAGAGADGLAISPISSNF